MDAPPVEKVECPECSIQVTRPYIGSHLKRVHKSEKNFGCTECDYRAHSRRETKNHEIKTHGKGAAILACDICSFRGVSPSELESHTRRIHLKLRTQVCPECGKRLSESNREHRECPSCEYRLPAAHQNSLSNHVKAVQLKIKDNNCDHCNFASSSTSGLTKHIDNMHPADAPD